MPPSISDKAKRLRPLALAQLRAGAVFSNVRGGILFWVWILFGWMDSGSKYWWICWGWSLERKDDPPKVQLGERCSRRCCGRESFFLGVWYQLISNVYFYFSNTFIILSYLTLLSMIRYYTTLISSFMHCHWLIQPLSRGKVSMWRRWIDANRRFLDAQMDVLADFSPRRTVRRTEEEDVQKFKLHFFFERTLWMKRVNIWW